MANKACTNDGKRVFAIDGTCLVKDFARNIEMLAVDYDGVLKNSMCGLSIMVCSLLVGRNAFPIDFRFWRNAVDKIGWDEKRNKNYKTKIELAIGLIKAYKDIIIFDYVAMDGAFCSEKMINFVNDEKLNYTMRIARDRVVMINGKLLQLRYQPALKLIRNERCKSANGFYKCCACTFTVHKQKQKNGKWKVMFIISNMKLSAKDHVVAYSKRWGIEKCFRTMKQSLGLKDCQMLSSTKQRHHIFNVFLAYSMATIEKIANKKKSVEEILKIWRNSKIVQNFYQNNDSAVI
jgi:hypothetical protein